MFDFRLWMLVTYNAGRADRGLKSAEFSAVNKQLVVSPVLCAEVVGSTSSEGYWFTC